LERRASDQEVATTNRVGAAEKYARIAARRDQLAARRDTAAAARDRAAEDRDAELAKLEALLRENGSPLESVVSEVKRLRAQAALDRAFSADDRRLAARDRTRSARERVESLEALRGAHFDELTGALRRGFGEERLCAEIERAKRSDGRLVLAIVDVDGLKEVNDRDGHFAGDQLLCDLVAAIRANIRTFGPIVRLGGDEFAFTIAGIDGSDIGERCAVIRADLARRPSGGTFTVGVAELRPDSDLSDLLGRADAALVEARLERGQAGRALFRQRG
jgi:diguanylate cyclase (GGDEF)-like protein